MKRRPLSLLTGIALLLGVAGLAATRAAAQGPPGAPPPPTYAANTDGEGPPPTDRTPPRLSYTDGQVSFWRPGAGDWTQARVNTPLAPGDQLYTGSGSNLELQIGPRDFLRVASNSRLAFDNDETDYRQFRLTSGQASVDLRGMRAGQTVEVDTPNGAFTIDHNGYYRVEVGEDATHFAARRGGRATVTPESGNPEDISPSEEVVVRGHDVESYAASEPDAWDRWNYDRSDQLIDAVSYRHVPGDVYGADDLDHSGRWRVVPQYGSLWFPSRVATGWAPYTSGHWILDPYFGWTWVDDAPWGWAPFHYGRWLSIGGLWGWAPGPIVARSFYAPALVAFFSAGPLSIGVSLGTPLLGWTALGWGEPCRPWWGPANFIGRPRWFGWGGPRVAIHQNEINELAFYQNARVHDGVVIVNRNRFGRGAVGHERVASANMTRFAPVRGALPVGSDPVRVVGGAARGARPPDAMLERRVVATRPTAAPASRGFFGGSHRGSGSPPNPSAQLVPPPREARARGTLQRPKFGEQTGLERAAPPPQRAERPPAPAPPAGLQSTHTRVARGAPQPRGIQRSAPPQQSGRTESSREAGRRVPRQPAAASAQQQNAAPSRHAPTPSSAPSRGRNARRTDAEQPIAAPDAAPPDAGSRGRGHRDR